jgi:hypothetical protein
LQHAHDQAKRNAMYPRYYALRRVNPYRGVTQVVDIGEAIAHSHDGLTWRLRADDGQGLVRPVGVWEEGAGLKLGHIGVDLRDALETRPTLPFPIFDTWELWLLDREEGLPLALLATERSGGQLSEQPEAEWHPFVTSFTGFRSLALTAREGIRPVDVHEHRTLLARMVNLAARPYPRAQWFRRGQDGAGEGGGGLRLPYEWRKRRLPAEAFPELLVREDWNNQLEQSVIADYHAYLAPLLLLWPRLSPATRDRVEALACQQPHRLARIQRLLPTRVDPARINAALVAARLEAAQGQPEEPWITD